MLPIIAPLPEGSKVVVHCEDAAHLPHICIDDIRSGQLIPLAGDLPFTEISPHLAWSPDGE
jgi:hypothetical protein